MIPFYSNPRFWIPLVANGLLSVLLVTLNTQLSPLDIHLFLPGLFPLFLAFNRPGPSGLIGCTFTGFMFDALTPLPMGVFATLFAGMHAAARVFSKRIHRENMIQFISFAFIFNILCWFAVTVATTSSTVWNSDFWAHFSVNLLLSQIVIIPIAAWFFEFQAATLRLLFGIRIFDEDLI